MDKSVISLREEFPGSWADELTVHAEQRLREAEHLYGERDRAWTFIGVQVGSFEKNVTWPIDKKRKLACICLQQLPPGYAWPDFLHFNLAHETIHLLSPPDADQVTYLEEGVAVSFSLSRTYANHNYLGEQVKIFEENPSDKYTVAWKDVDQLVRADPDAIKKLRLQNQSLSAISAAQIVDAVPGIEVAVAERLIRKFPV
ncbi:hypothetical protein WI604_03915 [Bradyrhizobium symbiodeficiens]|uniref:hypothetical protein n=1 Tax=Bradyrhizobium symbiodeficiens TaxID=1404367 RepID=UPI0030CA9217